MSRQFGLRHFDRGQGATEYVGVIAVVVAIVGALLMTTVGDTIAQGISTQVCKVTGGDNCGKNGDPQADGSNGSGDDQGGDDGGDGPANNTGATDPLTTPEQQAYDKAKSDLDKALTEYGVTKADLKKAAMELIKIAGEESGLTDALKCITEGDGSACTETVINALLMVVGGMPLKLAKKYLFNPKKAWNVGKSIVKNGTKIGKGLKKLYDQSKKIERLKKKAAELKEKADAARKKRKKELCQVAYVPAKPRGPTYQQAVYTHDAPARAPNGVAYAALPGKKDRPYSYFDRGGYRNYVLVDKNGKVYYSGMFGGKETPKSVQYRHSKNNNRFNPAKGDRIRVLPGTRTYGESRLLEQRTAEKYKTVIGKKGKDYRGNRQNPLGADKRAEYERYETKKKQKMAEWRKKNCQ
ncbi:hypothetical protein G5C51_35950 [Streptomyces sp. A7024]|uniref:Uncharacterized protein n=1 Tax=Streptomyces coryli TaxID=1128680 RepID=A0A6G4UD12_9ACTN|nr:hypothetical protein [Streptomyces coryli]NGN69268.1 hypothetical protein [Streptomyces coryli]